MVWRVYSSPLSWDDCALWANYVIFTQNPREFVVGNALSLAGEMIIIGFIYFSDGELSDSFWEFQPSRYTFMWQLHSEIENTHNKHVQLKSETSVTFICPHISMLPAIIVYLYTHIRININRCVGFTFTLRVTFHEERSNQFLSRVLWKARTHVSRIRNSWQSKVMMLNVNFAISNAKIKIRVKQIEFRSCKNDGQQHLSFHCYLPHIPQIENYTISIITQ